MNVATSDCLILGGGVIGLSLAWELAQSGVRVRVIDRGQPGQEASWAGAGMLPPGVRRQEDSALEQLQGLGTELHPEWHEKLYETTSIDNGFRRSGAVYLAPLKKYAGHSASLSHGSNYSDLKNDIAAWQARGIRADALDEDTLRTIEPTLVTELASNSLTAPTACFLPDECQIRNPRHLRALLVACTRAGVEISPGIEAEDFVVSKTSTSTTSDSAKRVTGVIAGGQVFEAAHVCITTGSWSAALVRRLGINIRVHPMRGQMVLLRDPHCALKRIVNVGPRYLVPRGDGLVLVGSTEEEVGFDRSTTAEGIQGLLDFALDLAPSLSKGVVERTWAGLRPATVDGMPYLGRLPGFENVSLAAGHFRAGLWLSPATAVVMRQAILGQQTEIDLTAFNSDKH
jgi:glycine oxidase